MVQINCAELIYFQLVMKCCYFRIVYTFYLVYIQCIIQPDAEYSTDENMSTSLRLYITYLCYNDKSSIDYLISISNDVDTLFNEHKDCNLPLLLRRRLVRLSGVSSSSSSSSSVLLCSVVASSSEAAVSSVRPR